MPFENRGEQCEAQDVQEMLDESPVDLDLVESKLNLEDILPHKTKLTWIYNTCNENGRRAIILAMVVGMSPVQDNRVLIGLLEIFKKVELPDELDVCELNPINLTNTGYPKEYNSVGAFSMSLAGAMADAFTCRDAQTVAQIMSFFDLYLESLFYKAMCKGVSAIDCLDRAVEMHLGGDDLADLPNRFAPQQRSRSPSRSRSRSASPKRK